MRLRWLFTVRVWYPMCTRQDRLAAQFEQHAIRCIARTAEIRPRGGQPRRDNPANSCLKSRARMWARHARGGGLALARAASDGGCHEAPPRLRVRARTPGVPDAAIE